MLAAVAIIRRRRRRRVARKGTEWSRALLKKRLMEKDRHIEDVESTQLTPSMIWENSTIYA